MRISDWSSDVCSSDLQTFIKLAVGVDLPLQNRHLNGFALLPVIFLRQLIEFALQFALALHRRIIRLAVSLIRSGCFRLDTAIELGRAWCRARVCQYV